MQQEQLAPLWREVAVQLLAQGPLVLYVRRRLYIYLVSRKDKFHNSDKLYFIPLNRKTGTTFAGLKGLIDLNFTS
jgi:hypothetical protein